MSYNYIQYDNLFYRMRQNLPKSNIFYYLIAIVKLLPLFLQTNTPGYLSEPDSNVTIHNYFRYISMSYYLQNSFETSIILIVTVIILIINLILLVTLVYYLLKAKKVKKLEDDHLLKSNSFDLIFNLFSNFAYFKYILLCQFFFEIDFLPLFCISSARDIDKIKKHNIFSREIDFSSVCEGSNFIYFITISIMNFILDISYNILLSSRFFDFNILSKYFWNCYSFPLYSFLFLESFSQIFFVMFINFNNSIYKIIFGVYVYLLFLLYIYKYIARDDFYSISMKKIMIVVDFARTMAIVGQIIIQIFTDGVKDQPTDINIGLIVAIELIFSYLKYVYVHKDNSKYVSLIFISNLNKLNEKNIYFSLYYLLTEFRIFSDVNYKFDDKNLDLFLENYVNHIKICEDLKCPCKNYIKKVSNASNTIKAGYTTIINFSHLGNDYNNREEYILNKFFNVLSANVSSTIKYTNFNVNVNNMKDNNKQKIIYNLRVRLINAVKKLISYKLEQLFINLDGAYSSNFSRKTKHFIRVNYFSLHLLCYKSFYKTFFLYQEFLSDFNKRYGRNYRFYMIYYYYIKNFGLREYDKYLNSLKSIKVESNSLMNVEYRSVLSLYTKFYEIEKKLIEVVNNYKDFILYIERKDIVLNSLLKLVGKFKSSYKNMTEFVRCFFKNEKINNLFISSKIILLFKILQFEIPENLHNKLIVQINENEDVSRPKSYVDSNYYIISNFKEGQFIIKFISHELLILLEYTEEELRDQDFNILLPEKLRIFHSQILVNEVKNKTNISRNKYKEVFFVGKRKTCILFDMIYKVLVNDKGELTFLCLLNIKKLKNEFKTCFACIDDSGEVLAVNREFEEYMLCSLKVLDYVKIDVEKIILQNNSSRVREFFKDEENNGSEFFDKYDYELYLNSLFGEEFEVLKDKNEQLYKKKHHRWESLKELVKKGRYYNRYIDIYVRQRMIGIHKIYFVRFLIKGNLIIKSITEPYNTTISLINAVKISKIEMAKLSFYKLDEIYEPKSEITADEPIEESHDFLNESQSILSSAAMILKEKNSKRYFKTAKNKFKFLPKSGNIMFLIIFLVIMSLSSIIYTSISMIIKFNYFNSIDDIYKMSFDIFVLKNSIQYLSLGVLNVPLIIDNLTPFQEINYETNRYVQNTLKLLSENIDVSKEKFYSINLNNNIHYSDKLDKIISMVNNNATFILENGLIYNKGNNNISISTNTNVYPYQEINKLYFSASNLYENFLTYKHELDIHFKENFLLNKFYSIQDRIDSTKFLSQDEIFIFYLMENFFVLIDPYLHILNDFYKNYFIDNLKSVRINMLVLKLMELFVLLLIAISEFYFIKMGYEKAKRKTKSLKEKVKSNNVEATIIKISEYIKFSNTYNIFSLYVIADFEFSPKKFEEKEIAIKRKSINPIKEKNDIGFSKNQNLTSPRRNYQEGGSTISLIEDKGQVNKSLIKLENIKKQRKNNPYITKDSISSKPDDPPSTIDINISDIPQDRKENDTFKINLESKINNEEKSFLRHTRTMDENNIQTNDVKNNVNGILRSSSFSTNDFQNMDITKSVPKKKGVLRSESISRKRSFYGQSINENKNEESNNFLINETDNNINMLKSPIQKKISFAGTMKKFYLPDKGINDNEITNQKKVFEKIQRKVENFIKNDRELPLIIESNKSFEIIKIETESAINTKEEPFNDEYKIPLTKMDSENNQSSNKLSKNQENLQEKINQNTTTRKKLTEIKLKQSQQEEIGEEIERVAYSNRGSRIFLFLFIIIFLILYIISLLFYFSCSQSLLSIHSFTFLLMKRLYNINELLLQYQLSLIKGNTQQLIAPMFAKITNNTQEIISMKLSNDYSYLKQTNLLESSTQDQNACKYFSESYSEMFNTSAENELAECSQIGNKININGFDDAYMNIVNTMSLLYDDLIKLDSVTEETIFEKVKDPTYFNIVEVIEYTMYKFNKLLFFSILNDMEVFFSYLRNTESILSYSSIIINIVFSFFSLIFVILPIKSVDLIISWILHKLVKNQTLNSDNKY